MSSQNVKSIVGIFGSFMFVLGLILMIIAEHVNFVFWIGLLLFLTSIMIGITFIIWRIAGTADKIFGRFIDGDFK